MADIDLGDTRLIIATCVRHGLLRNQAAYVLATAYWETARTMKPVREAFWLPENWRKKNLRYYPWYGRGYVQLTWESNYAKAGAKIGVDLIEDPNRALEPKHAAEILVLGMKEGWFTGKRLGQYVTLQASNFVGARRVVNGTDKAQAIAEIARDYDEALKEEGYGVDQEPDLANEHRDGTPPRKSKAQSTTLQAVGATGAAGATGVVTVLGSLDRTAQIIVVGAAVVAVLALAWIARERIKRWAEGDR